MITILCDACRGDGRVLDRKFVPKPAWVKCTDCNGIGKVPYKGLPNSVYTEIKKVLAPHVGFDDERNLRADINIVDRRAFERSHFDPIPYNIDMGPDELMRYCMPTAIMNLSIAARKVDDIFRHMQMFKSHDRLAMQSADKSGLQVGEMFIRFDRVSETPVKTVYVIDSIDEPKDYDENIYIYCTSYRIVGKEGSEKAYKGSEYFTPTSLLKDNLKNRTHRMRKDSDTLKNMTKKLHDLGFPEFNSKKKKKSAA